MSCLKRVSQTNIVLNMFVIRTETVHDSHATRTRRCLRNFCADDRTTGCVPGPDSVRHSAVNGTLHAADRCEKPLFAQTHAAPSRHPSGERTARVRGRVVRLQGRGRAPSVAVRVQGMPKDGYSTSMAKVSPGRRTEDPGASCGRMRP